MNTHYRSHVNNAPTLLTHHDRSACVDKVKGRLQVHSDYRIPLCLTHTHHQAIFRDPCIVYQNINRTKIILNLINHFLSILKIRSIRSITFHLYTQRSTFFFCILTVFINYQVCKSDICSFGSKLQCNRLTNTTSGTCHNRSLSC